MHVLDGQRLELLRRGESVYAVPAQFISHFGDFPCIAIGMLIGEWIDGAFVPSHELIARFGSQFTGRRFTLDADHVKQWLNGLDLRTVTPPYPAGSIILIEDEQHRYHRSGQSVARTSEEFATKTVETSWQLVSTLPSTHR